MKNSKYNIEFPSLIPCFRGFPHLEAVWVEADSKHLLRKSVEICARYFMREGYSDFLHYNPSNDDAVAYLFLDRHVPHAVGAACFRLREMEEIENPFWMMQWAWLHPFVRNKGLLSKSVGLFNERFGYWFPEYPHSKAMQSFVKKHGLIDPRKLELYPPDETKDDTARNE